MYAFKRSFLAVASISASLLALGAQALWAEPQYIITDVGTLGNQNQTTPEAINDQGDVVGVSSDRAFFYHHGVMMDLSQPGEAYSTAGAINNLGQVTFSSSPDRLHINAFLYSNGTTTSLGSLGGIETDVTGMNDSGQIVGNANTAASANLKPFLYSNGTMTPLPESLTDVYDINNSGQIVGRAIQEIALGNSDSQPALYSNGTIINLNTLGGEQGFALAINDAGEVVGDIYLQGNYHSFLYKTGKTRDLSLFKSAHGFVLAMDINNQEQILGSDGLSPFLYQNGTMQTLQDLIDPSFNWVLGSGGRINNRGQIAVMGHLSTDIDYSYYHALLLTPLTTPTQIPAAPAYLAAKPVGVHKIALTWAPVPEAADYHVLRSLTPGGLYTTIATVHHCTNYSDGDLQTNTAYSYRIVSVNRFGESIASSEATATPLTLPGEPLNFRATAFSSSQINLTWSEADGATNYTIYRSEASGTGRVIIGTTTGTSFSSTNLQPSTRYYYVVVAGNSYGYTKSAEVTTFTNIATPGRPSNVSATAVSTTQINLTWSAAANAQTYTIYRTISPGTDYFAVARTSSTRFSDVQLRPGTRYYYMIVAENDYLVTESSEVTARTFGTPSAPADLTATAASASQINLVWSKSEVAASYTIYRSTTLGGPGREIVGQTTVPRFADKNLHTATRYYYVVVAGNQYGFTKSNEVTARTNGLPNAPTNLTATVISLSRVDLNWNLGDGATSYTIYRSTTPGGPGRTIVGQTSSLTFSDTHIQRSTRYYYVVVAGNASGYTKSNEASATTLSGLPDAPSLVSATFINSTEINLTWSMPMGPTSTATQSYTIYRSATPGGPGRAIIGQLGYSAINFIDSQVQPGTRYYYVVVAGNQYGYTKSAEVSAVTPAQ